MMTERILHDIYMQDKEEGGKKMPPATNETSPEEIDEIISDGSGGAFEQTEEVSDTRETIEHEEDEQGTLPKKQYY